MTWERWTRIRRSKETWRCRIVRPVLERRGWRLYAHPLFLDQLERLVASVERAKRADPNGWQGRADARFLAALRALLLDRIPRDPLSSEFRQGNTLGKDRRHWFRAKFGGNRFRLFFRADSNARVIVFAWVNDRDTLRKAGASSDPYAVFSRMLASGNPPDDWPALLAAEPEAVRRFSVPDDPQSEEPA